MPSIYVLAWVYLLNLNVLKARVIIGINILNSDGELHLGVGGMVFYCYMSLTKIAAQTIRTENCGSNTLLWICIRILDLDSPVTLLVTLLGIMKNTVKLYLLYIYNKYNTLPHNFNISCKVPDSCPYFYINVCVFREGLFEFYVFYYIDKYPNSREAVNCLGNHYHPTSCLLTLPSASSLLSFCI